MRHALSLSQEQLARRVGVSFATVNRWERGRSRPRGAALQRLEVIRSLAPIPSAPAAARGPVGFPAPMTSFIGRAAELERLRQLLGTVRLVTLVGAGGSGKTRLAVEVLTSSTPEPAGEVRFASLEALVADDDLAGSLVAQVGDAAGGADGGDALAQAFAGTRLLVLDNCEHVLEASRRVVTRLLADRPDLRILATSREPLGLAAESVVRVSGLGADDPQHSDAVALFIDRVQKRMSSYGPGAGEVDAIAVLCRRLDGLPLAIELAAAFLPALSPAEISERLDHRFQLLVSHDPGSAQRHRALQATVAWSYDLLEPAEQRLFERLSIFPASFSFNAAEAVGARNDDESDASDVFLGLASLVDKSMVEVRTDGSGWRYELLESLREFGRERLAERGRLDEASALLFAWAHDFAGRAATGMVGPEQRTWLVAAALEADTAESALAWAVARGDAARAVGLAGRFWRYWYSRSDIRGGLRRLDAALALPGEVPGADRARALLGAGALARQRGDYAASVRYLREHLTLARQLGDDNAIADGYNSLAGALHGAGDTCRARAILQEGVAWWESRHDRHGLASALSNLGVLASDDGDYQAARRFGEQALAMRLALCHEESIAISYENLATAALRGGDRGEARHHFREALARYSALNEPDGIATALEGLAALAAAGVAVTLYAAAARLRRDIEVPSTPADEAFHRDRLVDLRHEVKTAEFDARWAAGEGLGVPAATSLALASSLGEDRGAAAQPSAGRLTRRERQVLELMTHGHTSKEMGAQLRLSPRTVERHLASIYGKVGARGRADAIAFGLRTGTGTPDAEP